MITALTREIIAICIANHHSSLMYAISPYGDTPFQDRMKKEKETLHYKEVIQTAIKEHIPVTNIKKIKKM